MMKKRKSTAPVRWKPGNQFWKLLVKEVSGGAAVITHISNVSDLVAADAQYHNDCQFSLTDLVDKIQGSYCPLNQTVKAQLLKKYGDVIVIAISPNKVSILFLLGSGIKILSDSWYSNRKSSTEEEKGRVVDAAGAIIAEDLCSYRSYHQIQQ
ncbi:hypothetical protein PR048_002978 [Dryococelus australis]|uniref:Uncharacterized protein n=1 Tax=Dryococelus australis TaxID=614101 RepID=A0ABQ9ILW0_9NEOP|nr:hypothetical protein PR048_002978 [Dryococelus australis]